MRSVIETVVMLLLGIVLGVAIELLLADLFVPDWIEVLMGPRDISAATGLPRNP